MNKIDKLSYSRLMEYNNCGYRWNLRYMRKIQRRTESRPMTLGSAVHVGMQAVFSGEDFKKAINLWKHQNLENQIIPVLHEDIESVNEEITAMYEEVSQTAEEIVERTLKYFSPDDWEVVVKDGKRMVEVHFESFVFDGIMYQGFVDLIATEKATGQNWLIDYKVRKTLQPDSDEEVNLQMASYQYLAKKAGIDTVGTIAVQILAKPNSKPKINKDGSMSKAKIATDWFTYKQALIENGLNPADYEEEMKSKLDSDFVRQSRAYRSAEEVQNIWDEIIRNMVVNYYSFIPTFRKPNSMNCKTCWAREFCLEELRGQNVDHLLENQYQYIKGGE